VYLSDKDDELSVREAAELLGVTVTWIYELVRDGKLKPVREERKSDKRVWRFFRRADVEQLRSSEMK